MSDGRAWDEANKAQAIEYILDAMASGQSLTRTLQLPFMPAPGTFARWRHESPELQARYLRAREALADFWADEVVPIADEATDSDSAAAARVRVEARRWAASKFGPVTYGEQAAASLTLGPQGLQIVLGRFHGAYGTLQAPDAPASSGMAALQGTAPGSEGTE